jgi:hypothetical protein
MQLSVLSHVLQRAIAITVLFAAVGLPAQNAPTKKSTPIVPSTKNPAKPAKAKLTPQQEHGLRLLSSAESEAPGLQPDMRAFVLWQASRGYTKLNPAKADSLLKNAFRATLSIDKGQDRCTHSEAELCGTKYWLQKQILRDLIEQSKRISEIQPLLASAEAEVRQMMSTNLFHRYVREKAFARARDLLNRTANENGYFSYGSATELIDALPREQSQDRIGVFSQALEAYRQHSDEKYPTSDDLAMMVLRVWQDLPPTLALDAIDQIFDRAKDADEEQQNISVGVSANNGDAYFSSVYQFRLYQLMPVLEQLDKARAESLLGQNSEVQAVLGRYPEGLASMNALPHGNTRSGSHVPGILSMGAIDATQAPAERARYEITRRQDRILNEAEKDPEQALSEAMSLPLNSGLEEYDPRTSTLSALAQIAATNHPDVSRAALGEIRKIATNLSIRDQARILTQLPELYLRLGDQDEARNSLKELVKIAAKLYGQDSDLDDPNQAFKGMWPSANLWRHCIAVATRFAPMQAEEIVQDIPDPEIRAFERITLANSLLGASTAPLSVIEKHRKGISASIGL